jgi:hypothetical protein
MRIGFCRLVWLFVMFLAGSTVLSGAQSPATKGGPDLEAVKERTAEYYRDVVADNLEAAHQFVAPESKNDFFHMVYSGLTDFRIGDASLSEKGDEATVIVTWIQKPPQFPGTVNHDVRNTWKRIDGQWYIVLPSPKELQSPFGTMQLGAKDKPSAGATAALEQEIQKRQANVDEDQYLIALQKAQKANAAKAEEKKSSETKSQDDKAKPESQPAPQN